MLQLLIAVVILILVSLNIFKQFREWVLRNSPEPICQVIRQYFKDEVSNGCFSHPDRSNTVTVVLSALAAVLSENPQQLESVLDSKLPSGHWICDPYKVLVWIVQQLEKPDEVKETLIFPRLTLRTSIRFCCKSIEVPQNQSLALHLRVPLQNGESELPLRQLIATTLGEVEDNDNKECDCDSRSRAKDGVPMSAQIRSCLESAPSLLCLRLSRVYWTGQTLTETQCRVRIEDPRLVVPGGEGVNYSLVTAVAKHCSGAYVCYKVADQPGCWSQLHQGGLTRLCKWDQVASSQPDLLFYRRETLSLDTAAA